VVLGCNGEPYSKLELNADAMNEFTSYCTPCVCWWYSGAQLVGPGMTALIYVKEDEEEEEETYHPFVL